MSIREQLLFALVGAVLLAASLAWSDPRVAAAIDARVGFGRIANQACASPPPPIAQ
jgi:hypothetical protein